MSGVKCLVSSVRCLVSSVSSLVSSVRCLVSSVWCQVSGIKCLVSSAKCLVARCLVSSVWCLVSSVRSLVPWCPWCPWCPGALVPRLHAVAERTGAEGGQPVEEEGAAVAHGHRHPHVAAQAGIVVAGARLPLTTHCGQGPAPQVQPHRRHRATAPRLQQAGRRSG